MKVNKARIRIFSSNAKNENQYNYTFLVAACRKIFSIHTNLDRKNGFYLELLTQEKRINGYRDKLHKLNKTSGYMRNYLKLYLKDMTELSESDYIIAGEEMLNCLLTLLKDRKIVTIDEHRDLIIKAFEGEQK